MCESFAMRAIISQIIKRKYSSGQNAMQIQVFLYEGFLYEFLGHLWPSFTIKNYNFFHIDRLPLI